MLAVRLFKDLLLQLQFRDCCLAVSRSIQVPTVISGEILYKILKNRHRQQGGTGAADLHLEGVLHALDPLTC